MLRASPAFLLRFSRGVLRAHQQRDVVTLEQDLSESFPRLLLEQELLSIVEHKVHVLVKPLYKAKVGAPATGCGWAPAWLGLYLESRRTGVCVWEGVCVSVCVGVCVGVWVGVCG